MPEEKRASQKLDYPEAKPRIALDKLDVVVFVKDVETNIVEETLNKEDVDAEALEYRAMTDSELLQLPRNEHGHVLHVYDPITLMRIEALDNNLLSDFHKERLQRWRSFPFKGTETNASHLLEMIKQLKPNSAEFMFESGSLRGFAGNLNWAEMVLNLTTRQYLGPEDESVSRSGSFKFRAKPIFLAPTEEPSYDELEVTIRIVKDHICRYFFALVAFSETNDK